MLRCIFALLSMLLGLSAKFCHQIQRPSLSRHAIGSDPDLTPSLTVPAAISSASRLQPHIRRIVVADAQVPFVQGGAELHVAALIEQLRQRGYEVEKVAIPFRGQPKSELLSQAAA